MKKRIQISTPRVSCLLLVLILFAQCKKEDLEVCTDGNASGHPTTEPCETGLTLEEITTTGTTTETANGVQITGDVTIPQGGGSAPTFGDAVLDITANEQGEVVGITGTGTIPAADGFIAFDDPITGNIGYFTGKWLNENEDFCITLKDTIRYFVYNVQTSFKMRVGGNNDPNASKPLTIKVPLGGQILMIMNYDDPMFFIYGELDLLGAMGFGMSKAGNIVYAPDFPIEQAELQGFDGNMIKCAKATFGKILTLNGSLVYNQVGPLDALVNNEADGSALKIEHARGFNGKLEAGLPIKKIGDLVEFKLPLAEGSAAFKTSLNTKGEFEAKVFIRGVQDTDDSWWPAFIPIGLTNTREITAFIEESGRFEAGIAAEFGIQMPGSYQGLSGKATINNDAFTIEGIVHVQAEEWGGSASFGAREMELMGTPPADYLADFEVYATELIDEKFAEADSLRRKYEAAVENYELELSLRGLRSDLPKVLRKVLEIIDDQVADALAEARKKIKAELTANDRFYKSDNLTKVVGDLVKPYKTQINKLIDALEKADNENVRRELKEALTTLADMKNIDKRVTVEVVHRGKILGVYVDEREDSRTVSVKINVLTNDQVSQLLKAAEYVQYLQEASDIMVSTREIIAAFPTTEELNKLKSDIQSGVKQFLEIGGAGFTYTYETKKYDFFLLYGGVKKPIGEMNIFDGKALADLITFEF